MADAESQSLQEQYAPENACFGCGPANPDGLHIRSFVRGDEVVAEWKPETRYEAFPGVLNGGIIGALLDCHCNWTAAWHLMNKSRRRSAALHGDGGLRDQAAASDADRCAGFSFRESGRVGREQGDRRWNADRRRKSLRDLSRDFCRGEGRPSGVPSLVGIPCSTVEQFRVGWAPPVLASCQNNFKFACETRSPAGETPTLPETRRELFCHVERDAFDVRIHIECRRAQKTDERLAAFAGKVYCE